MALTWQNDYKAYNWAEQRKLETHPKTGAAQLVEVRELVKEITIPKYVEVEQAVSLKPQLFEHISNDDLLRYGVPAEWLNDVRLANEDSLMELVVHLPSEAAEALLELATGNTPQLIEPVSAVEEPFEHPDAQRRFRVMSNVEELERALEYPWEKWTVFLHPAQREYVERSYRVIKFQEDFDIIKSLGVVFPAACGVSYVNLNSSNTPLLAAGIFISWFRKKQIYYEFRLR